MWTPVTGAGRFATPFLGENDVTFDSGLTPWTLDFSHGQILRTGYDETLQIDPNNLQFLYQADNPQRTPPPTVKFLGSSGWRPQPADQAMHSSPDSRPRAAGCPECTKGMNERSVLRDQGLTPGYRRTAKVTVYPRGRKVKMWYGKCTVYLRNEEELRHD